MKPLLITGAPSVGKTTLFKSVLRYIQRECTARVTGFYVNEVRGDGGARVGFELVDIADGEPRQFAGLAADLPPGATNIPRVGKWCVHIDKFEEIALPIASTALGTASEEKVVLMIDEIAKMELLSEEFASLMSRLLASPPASLYLICAIAMRGSGLVASAKELPNVELITVTHENRDQLLDHIILKVNKALKE